jgi:predicted phage terminase large subunit-like protein
MFSGPGSTFPDLVRQADNQANKHQPDVVLIENLVSGSSLIQTLNDRGWSGVIGRKPDGDKATRIIRHTHKLEADPLFVPKFASYLDDFKAEFLGFPYGRHDDQIDALSQFYAWYDERCRRTPFSADFGGGEAASVWGERLGAPSATEILGFRGF